MKNSDEPIKDHLTTLKIEDKGSWVVLFEGKRLKLTSGKQAWSSSGAARNAIANEFYYMNPRRFGFKNGSELRKDLEHRGIIEVKKL